MLGEGHVGGFVWGVSQSIKMLPKKKFASLNLKAGHASTAEPALSGRLSGCPGMGLSPGPGPVNWVLLQLPRAPFKVRGDARARTGEPLFRKLRLPEGPRHSESASQPRHHRPRGPDSEAMPVATVNVRDCKAPAAISSAKHVIRLGVRIETRPGPSLRQHSKT